MELLSRPVVQQILDHLYGFCRYGAKVEVLWKVLADEAVEILDATFLPRRIGVTEVAPHFVVFPRLVMEGILGTVVSRNTLPEPRGIFLHLGTERPLMTRRTLVRDFGDSRQHEGAVVLHRQNLLATATNNGVIFPVANSFSFIDPFGPLVNADPVLQGETLFSPLSFLSSFPVPLPQIRNAIFSIPVIDPGVDGFMAHRVAE